MHNQKSSYLSSALLLLVSTVVIKVIGAFYKIPLTAFIGAVGRGYFSTAYNLYIPLHAVLMGAFPIALSRLVSQYTALGDREMLASLKKASFRFFLFVGLAGTGLLVLFAKPYAVYIADAPKSLDTILVLAPGLLLSCLCAYWRGWYEGRMDMKPTALSQIFEALFKFVLGLLLAKRTMDILYTRFLQTGRVLSSSPSGREAAMSAIYPHSSAAAMLGVSLGTLFSLLFLFVYDRINADRTLPRVSAYRGRKAFLSFSFPILLSCAVQSVFQFLDTASVQYVLGRMDTAALRYTLAPALSQISVSDTDLPSYAYGLFCTALDFKNLVPGITMALGVCAVPALCREFEAGNRERLETQMNSVYRYTALLSVFLGAFMLLASEGILTVFYASSPDIVTGGADLVKVFAATAPLYSLASTAVFTVQALGKPEKSVVTYILSGALRVGLNVLLVRDVRLHLYGAVLAGAVGYLVLFLMNYRLSKRLSGVKLQPLQTLIKPVVIGFLSVFALILLQKALTFSKSALIKLLIDFVVFTAIYYILCRILKVLDFKEIFSMLKLKNMA